MLACNEHGRSSANDTRWEKKPAVPAYSASGDRRPPELRSPPSGGEIMETPQILSIKPIRKWGHSQVVTVGREVRQALNVKPGDLIAFRKIGRYVFILAVNAVQLAPVTKQEMALAREAWGG